MRKFTTFAHLRFGLAFVSLVVVSGLGTFIFLKGLEWVTLARVQDHRWFLFCPVAGLITGWLYHLAAGRTGEGNVLIARSLKAHPRSYDPALVPSRVPGRMAPLILITTWLAHLGGASVGREGTAVQLAGGMSAWIAHGLRISEEDRWRLLFASAAAGFGSVFGVPLAGAVFAFELVGRDVLAKRDQRDSARARITTFIQLGLLSLSASFGANWVAMKIGTGHGEFSRVDFTALTELALWPALLIAALGSGVLAWLFLNAVAKMRLFIAGFRVQSWLKPALGGVPLALLYFLPDAHRFAGLGANVIQASFLSSASFGDPLLKIAFTSYAIGVGFRGGEVTPLFFIGATYGSSLAGAASDLAPGITAGGSGWLVGLSMVAVFGAAARVPLASAVMAGELMGWPAFVIALPFCLLSSAVCRTGRLYDAQ